MLFCVEIMVVVWECVVLICQRNGQSHKKRIKEMVIKKISYVITYKSYNIKKNTCVYEKLIILAFSIY